MASANTGQLEEIPEWATNNKISLPIITDLEQRTHSVIYALMDERLHGNHSLTYGKTPFCHDGALGEWNPREKKLVREGCAYICCHVEPGAPNTIAAGPGELSTTTKSTAHLAVVEPEGQYFGGSRVSCTTGHCNPSIDAKFKDCEWYPFFLLLNEEEVLEIKVGTKCPMPHAAKILHLLSTIKYAAKTIDKDPRWVDFLKKAYSKMVGYQHFDYTFLATTTEDDLRDMVETQIRQNSYQEGCRVASDPRTRDLPMADKQALVERYEDDMKKMLEQALVLFHELKSLDIDFERGISLQNLATIAKKSLSA